MEENIGKRIVNNLKKCGRGSIFFPNSFVSYGDIKSVSKSLERLTKADWCLCHEPSWTIYPGAYECGLPDRRITKKD